MFALFTLVFVFAFVSGFTYAALAFAFDLIDDRRAYRRACIVARLASIK